MNREQRGAKRRVAPPTRRATPRVATEPAPSVAASPLRGPTKRGDRTRWKISTRALVAVVVAAVLGIGYLVGLAYFSKHFTPGTTVGGVDASMLSVEELAPLIEAHVGSYRDKVSGEGLDFTVTAQDVSLSCDGLSCATEAMSQIEPASWPLDLFAPRHFEAHKGIRFDTGALEALVKEVVDTYNGVTDDEFQEDTIVYDDKRGEFVSTNELASTMLNAASVSDAIAKDIAALNPQTVIDSSSLKRPALTDEDRQLMEAAEQANLILDLDFPLTFEGTELMRIDRDLIRDWLIVVEGDNGPKAVASASAIADWAYANLNAIVNGESETRTWEVDSPTTGEQLAEHLSSLDDGPYEVATITIAERPPESEGARQRGRHVDVNITTQYARLYDTDGTVLWRSYVVTGDPNLDRDTPIGDFEIINMAENVTLTGADEDGDGAPDYESFVYYWMCFYGASYGLHDATWRTDGEFGSNTYAYDGSHGCVNLPFDKAAELYGLLQLGDPVVIHY